MFGAAVLFWLVLGALFGPANARNGLRAFVLIIILIAVAVAVSETSLPC
jgi:hypothetical protein